jgi:MraZ protein
VLLFTGHAEVTIDPKQRLQIPAKYRAIWEGAAEKAWHIVPWVGGVMRLYPETTFSTLAKGSGRKLIPSGDEAQLEADFFGFVERVEPDSAGRITLPRWQLEMTQVGTDVVVIGAGNRLEIRARSKWSPSQPDRLTNLAALAERMALRDAANGS